MDEGTAENNQGVDRILELEKQIRDRNATLDAKAKEVLSSGSAASSKPVEKPTKALSAVPSRDRRRSSGPQVARQLPEGDQLRAHVTALEEELHTMVAKLQVAENENKSLAKELAKQQKGLAAQTAKAEKERAAAEKATLEVKELSSQVASLQKGLSAAQQKVARAADASASAKDQRLQRALDEIASLKNTIKELQQTQHTSSTSSEQHEQLQRDHQKLSKQHNDLLLAFKKQAKLIDVLKRQKMHLEAVKLLSFTEEEFVKTLEVAHSLGS